MLLILIISVVLKAEVMTACYNSCSVLHLHLIASHSSYCHLPLYQNSSFPSPLKLPLHHFPSSRHKGIQPMSYIMHQKCKLKQSSRRRLFSHFSHRCLNFYRLPFTKPCLLLSLCVCCRSVECTSCRIRTERRFISHHREQLLAGEKWEFSLYSLTTHRPPPCVICIDNKRCCCIQCMTRNQCAADFRCICVARDC